MELRSLKEVKGIRGKRVLVRLDLDVPVGDDGVVDDTDDKRLEAALPTLKYLLTKGAQIVVAGHRGRPKGRRISTLTMKPIVEHLAELLGAQEGITEDRVEGFDAYAFTVGKKWISVLENIRFHPGEVLDHAQLAKQLAQIADIYVNDAFAVSHRKHASVSAITKKLPSYAGLQLVKEVKTLGVALKRPPRPLTLMVGGVKAETKLKLIEKFLPRADYILIGSALANNFYAELGFELGASRRDIGVKPMIKKLMSRPQYKILGKELDDMLLDPAALKHVDTKLLKSLKKRIILPADVVLGEVTKDAAKQNKKHKSVLIESENKDVSPHPYSILDIGERTIMLYQEIIKRSKTIIWNGPMGMFELPPYNHGTYQIAKSVAGARGKAILGGGDTIAAVESEHVTFKQNTFISTGGGAMLEFLIDPHLPGIKPLIKKS